MAWKLGALSLVQYETLHPDLQQIINTGLELCPVDFGIKYGYRDPDLQFNLYTKGRQKINGIWRITSAKDVITYKDGKDRKSNHNYLPSRAFDFYAYIPGKPHLGYDKTHLIAIGSSLITASKLLYSKGIISHTARWGANWDNDGELITDQNFIDLPHIEILI